jgi:hypothetical protein
LPYHLEEAGASSKVKNCLTEIEMFRLWWTPKFKKDFIKFWLYLLTGSSDISYQSGPCIPNYDICDEYVKSLDDFCKRTHPHSDLVSQIVLEIAGML